jgi:ornithine cyclodeaminase/alanine dehydrogenase-like protein (mu-crystallin family)
VLPFEDIRVWSRSAEKCARFAGECSQEFGVAVRVAASAEAAVRDADIVVTATSSAAPVLEAAWIRPGAHINAMGSNQAGRRELPADLVMRAGLIAVDSLEQSRMESGDLLMAFDGRDWDRVTQLQDVVAGRAARTGPEEITIFKSNGLAVEDVAAAGFVFERAAEAEKGYS